MSKYKDFELEVTSETKVLIDLEKIDSNPYERRKKLAKFLVNDFPKAQYTGIALCEMNRLFILKYSVWLQLPRDELATFGRYQDLYVFITGFHANSNEWGDDCTFRLFLPFLTPFINTDNQRLPNSPFL